MANDGEIYGVAEYIRDWPDAFADGSPIAQRMCNHGCYFDKDDAKDCTPYEVRARWPRFFGECRECGYQGIYYDSYAHYIWGDW